jgi:diguanylate cyclase (GGDEF)-like protein/PAS domain S-box-containing protein
MPFKSRDVLANPRARYVWPFLAVAASFLLREALVEGLGLEMPTFITFYPAVMAMALLYGFWPGILATALTVLTTGYLILEPRGSFAISRVSDVVALTLFTGVGIFMSVVAEGYRREQGRKRVEEGQLHQAEMMRLSFDAIIITRTDGCIESWNWGAEQLYGYSASEALGSDAHKMFRTSPAVPWPEIHARLRKNSDWEYELHQATKDDREIVVSARYHLLVDEYEVERILQVNRDITEHKRTERRIQQLVRVYNVLSEINQTIVRVSDSQALLEAACDIAVDKGEFRMVWIGMINHATQMLEPIASAGATDGYLDKVAIDLRGKVHGTLPAMRCLATGAHAICNDIEHEPPYMPPYNVALQLNYRSSASFPLHCDGKLVGVFNLYSSESGYFDEEEIRLLDEMAMDISYALKVNQHEADRKKSDKILQESLATLQESQIIGGIGSYKTDFLSGAWTSSPVLNEIFGIDEAFERTVAGWIALVHPDDREMMSVYLEKEVAAKGIPFDKEYRIIRPANGAERWVHGMGRVEFGRDGKLLSMAGVIQDITEYKRVMESLRASELLYRTTFQTNPDFITISHLSDGKYIEVNNAFLRAIGFTRDELIGQTAVDLNIWFHAHDRQNFVTLLTRGSVCRNVEAKFRKKNGEIFWVLISASVFMMNGVPCLFAITRDNSEAKQAESKIKHLAFFDSLTSLPNRSLLLDRLNQTLTASSRNHRLSALLFIDLDNFKLLNDTHGHHVGDMQLKEVAKRLTGCVRESDTVARLGGDEFVVLLEELSEIPEEAAARAGTVASKILAVISEPYLLIGHEHRSTASIGINVFGNQHESAHDVLKQADIAMYQAKGTGRNDMRFFAPALQAAIDSRATLEEELRVAMRAEQFLLLYQPQIEDGRIFGAEALVRWNHPVRGIIAPGEFITLAEETGLILPLGAWVLDTACKQIAAWAAHRQMSHIVVAVNISARQFHQADFVEQVLSTLERTGAPARCLKLELTESMLVDNIEEVITKMTKLKMHGVTFSVDDFGTGYSSLLYLKRLPLDQLKIDRSFVRDITQNAGSSAIASAIISMSRAMEMSVIAEGVETEEQRQCLAGMGCSAFQGYLFSRPVPPEELQQKMLSVNTGFPSSINS